MPLTSGLQDFLFIRDAQRTLRALGRFVPLRERHVLTRHNQLRLRYVCVLALSLAALTAVAVRGAVQASAFVVASLGESVQTAQAPVVLATATPAAPGAILLPPPAVSRGAGGLITLAAATPAPWPTVAEGEIAYTQKRLQRYREAAAALVPSVHAEAVRAAQLPADPRQKTVRIGKGDTLGSVLQKAGLSGADAQKAVAAIATHYNPRDIRPGQMLDLRFDETAAGEGFQLASLSMTVDPLRTVSLARAADEDGFKSTLEEKPVTKRIVAKATDINVSLYNAAVDTGIPVSVVAGAIRVLSYDVDFQRDIQKGDRLEVLYEVYETAEGKPVKTGDVLFARLSVSGRAVAAYRYENKEGTVDYFTPEGKSIRKTLLVTPIDGARLSSGFGMRRHPILGYSKMHKGADFAAPTGTPIYAAGDGVVEKSGRNGAYGNYVRLRHNAGLKTAYAHMSRYGKGIKQGVRVKQGQIIGYVGTTGRSTGPHLHYEVLVDGVQVNPRTAKVAQQSVSLKGNALTDFKAMVQTLEGQFVALVKGVKMAAIEPAADIPPTVQ